MKKTQESLSVSEIQNVNARQSLCAIRRAEDVRNMWASQGVSTTQVCTTQKASLFRESGLIAARFTPIVAVVLGCFLLTGCVAPLIVGGAATVGTLATREKGVSGALSDSQISVIVKGKLYKYSPDLHAHVGVNVQSAEVLLTGAVPKEEWQVEAERLAWQADGVKNVMNNITVLKDPNSVTEIVGSVPKDSWLTMRIKSGLLFLEDVSSLNYSIKTVDEVVYVMGIAQSEAERDRVLKLASETAGVKKVVDYTKLLDETDKASAHADQ